MKIILIEFDKILQSTIYGNQTSHTSFPSGSLGVSHNKTQEGIGVTYNETTVLNEDCENNKQKIATDNDITLLDEIRTKNINRLIISNLNINSLSSKFEQLKVSIQGKIDILIITETKLDDSFSVDQFAMNGYTKPYRFDRNRNGGGVTI